MKQKHRGRIYWPDCKVCQYMKRNPPFKDQIMESSYFDPQGKESLAEVLHRWGDPFPMPSVYSHMRRHQSKETRAIDVIAPIEAIPLDAIETPVTSETAHERALDEIIAKGRQAIRTGELKVTLQGLNSAVKTKAEIERSTKDRRLEAVKAFFLGDDGGPEPSQT